MIDLKSLIKSGVHFGHETSKWNPKMRPFIWGAKNNIHLIDVSKTASQLEKAAKFLESIAAQGKSILWVGTKKAAQKAIEKVTKELNLPFVVHRWIGGTFSNYRQVRKSVANLLHYEDILSKAAQTHYSKKELNVIQKKLERLDKNVGGIRKLTWPVGAVVVIDAKKEHVCIKEAIAMRIPIVAIVDTNSDPSFIDYVIPANDDVPRSIEILVNYLAEATKKGLETAQVKPTEDMIIKEDLVEHVMLPEDEEEGEAKSGSKAVKAKKAPQRNNVRVKKASTDEV